MNGALRGHVTSARQISEGVKAATTPTPTPGEDR